MRFVVTSHGARVSSIVDAISDLADDVTITCRLLNRPTGGVAVEGANAIAALDRTNPVDEAAQESNRPQLAYIADLGASHRRYIDVEASLRKLSLTKDQLMSRTWPRGSPQDRLKRAAASKPKNGPAAD